MDVNLSISCELQSFVRIQHKRIKNANNPVDIEESLSLLQDVLNKGSLPSVDLSNEEKKCIRAEFRKKHFVRCSELLLCEPAVSFLSSLDDFHQRILGEYFSNGRSSDSLIVLVGALNRTSRTCCTDIISSLIENLISSKRLVDILTENCTKEDSGYYGNGYHGNQVITYLVSLPERIANKLKLHTNSIFYPDCYFIEMAKQIIESLKKLHSHLSIDSRKVSLEFLSNLIGRICMSGHGKTLLVHLLPQIDIWLGESPLWTHICHKLIIGISDHELEHVIENLLKLSPHKHIVSKLLGQGITSNSRLKFLLTTKFLLLRYYSGKNILMNIIGYLAAVSPELLSETLFKLLDSWGKNTAIQHTPYNQHLYISCAIVHITGYLSNTLREKHKNEVLKKLLIGIQNHLESADHKVRRLGMIVAECLTSSFEPNTEKLQFDYEKDIESELITELLKGPNCEVEDGSDATKPLFSPSKEEKELKPMAKDNRKIQIGDVEDEDDLEPFDLDEGPEGKSIHHLRECMEALMDSKNVEKFESALNTLENIVRSSPSDLDEVCVELMKILLHLQDQFSTENFAILRFKSMVAIATRCPIKISSYLTEEFYGANYSVIQRLDVLDVIAASAKVLSQPIESSTKEKLTSKKFLYQQVEVQNEAHKIPEWQRIVDERIKRNTRRFSKGPSKEQAKPVANRFTNVAGDFFYPLMKNFDHKQNTLDLLGEDHYVLGRLIYTLGVIMHHSADIPGILNMASTLIEFSWALRYHREAVVRQMLIFALVMVFTSVPITLLLHTSKDGIFEIHDWLKGLIDRDENIDVKKIAVQALMVLEEAFKKEMNQE